MNAKNLFVLYLLIGAVFGCEKTSETEQFNTTLDGSWNVVTISGGFAGVEDDFEIGTIVWKFNPSNNTLIVQNDNASGAVYDGLESGNYFYSIAEIGENSFMFIGEGEFGAIVMGENEMVIDQNKMSAGSGADKFIIKLAK